MNKLFFNSLSRESVLFITLVGQTEIFCPKYSKVQVTHHCVQQERVSGKQRLTTCAGVEAVVINKQRAHPACGVDYRQGVGLGVVLETALMSGISNSGQQAAGGIVSPTGSDLLKVNSCIPVNPVNLLYGSPSPHSARSSGVLDLAHQPLLYGSSLPHRAGSSGVLELASQLSGRKTSWPC